MCTEKEVRTCQNMCTQNTYLPKYATQNAYLPKYATQNAYLTGSAYLKHVPNKKVKFRLNLQNITWQP